MYCLPMDGHIDTLHDRIFISRNVNSQDSAFKKVNENKLTPAAFLFTARNFVSLEKCMSRAAKAALH
jgi:hypothetical protein